MKSALLTRFTSASKSLFKRLKLDLTKYTEEHYFKFDSAYSENNTNLDIYNDAVKPIVDFALAGRKVSCFAYGQTGKLTRQR